MRNLLALSDNPEVSSVITYGCSAHLANLVSKDIRDESIIEKIKKVIKYFRNHKDPRAKYLKAGGTNLVLPCDVRWNSVRDCLESFVKNYSVLTEVVSTYKHAINDEIYKIIIEDNLLGISQFLIRKLNVVGKNLAKLQSDNCFLSEAFELWTDMKEFFDINSNDSIDDINADLMNFNERYELALSVYHVIANMLDPRYKGNRITAEQRQNALKYLKKENGIFIAELIKFNGETGPYLSSFFDPDALKNTNPYIWWKGIANIPDEFRNFCLSLFSCVSSSGGIERIFSTFGIVHTKLRNRLQVQKTGKLVAIFKNLNQHKHEFAGQSRKRKLRRNMRGTNNGNTTGEATNTDEENDVEAPESEVDFAESFSESEAEIDEIFESE